MTDETGTTTAKRPKGRSPLYPAVNLETALQRARQLYEKERLHPTPVATIVTHWKYRSLNGPAAQTLAALKKYGLIEDEGTGEQRKARLSALADAILSHPEEEKRKAGIREAALRPAMLRELWDKYHVDLPSDSNLRWELTHDRGFTETGATEFIRVYKATVQFAQLTAPVREPTLESSDAYGDEGYEHQADGDGDREEPNFDPPVMQQRQPSTGAAKSYPIPLIGGGVVTVQGSFPISEVDWNQFMAVLAAMKPGLVQDGDVM